VIVVIIMHTIDLDEKLGVHFKNPTHLVTALTRKSYVKECRDQDPTINMDDNERYEFLGDAVLELAVRQYLFRKMKGDKGDLSTLCDKIVDNENLHRIAEALHIECFLHYSKNEAQDEEGKETILAGALEAIIAAIYLDQKLPTAKRFVENKIIKPTLQKRDIKLDH